MSFLEPETHRDVPGVWPVGPLNSVITELALDAAMPPATFNDQTMPRVVAASLEGRRPRRLDKFLDLLDQHLYTPYSNESRNHLCAPRYEFGYRGVSIMGLLEDNLDDKAFDLVIKDVTLSTVIEEA